MKRNISFLILASLTFFSCEKKEGMPHPRHYNPYPAKQAPVMKESRPMVDEGVERIIRHIEEFPF